MTTQAWRQPALAAEPLRDEVRAVHHQRALTEEAQRREAERQRDQPGNRTEQHARQAEQQDHGDRHAPRPVAVDELAHIGQAERRDQSGRAVGRGDRGAGQAEVAPDRPDEHAEGVRLAGAAREDAQPGHREHHPAAICAPVEGLEQALSDRGRGHRVRDNARHRWSSSKPGRAECRGAQHTRCCSLPRR
jgi:hypothetical protein